MLLLFSLVVSVAITGNCLPVLAEISLQASRRADNQSGPFLERSTLWPQLIPVSVNCACRDDAATGAYSSRPLLWRCQMQKVQNGGCCRDQLACCLCFPARQLALVLSRQARACYHLQLTEPATVTRVFLTIFWCILWQLSTLCFYVGAGSTENQLPEYIMWSFQKGYQIKVVKSKVGIYRQVLGWCWGRGGGEIVPTITESWRNWGRWRTFNIWWAWRRRAFCRCLASPEFTVTCVC